MPLMTYRMLELPLEFTFTISRSSKTVAKTVLLELMLDYQGQAYTGLGEAVPSSFYGENAESVMAFYRACLSEGLLEHLDPFNQQELERRLALMPDNWAAKAAIDMAMLDIRGKILGIPVYRLLGLDPLKAPKTSYTIGIDTLENVKLKTETALSRGYDVLKVKLGGENDLKSLELIRQLAPEATLRVDANAAWTLKQALEMLTMLKSLDVEFVEEPLKLFSDEEDYVKLKAKAPLPLMADESCHRLRDIPRCARLFDSINLKLTKTGGIHEAIRMIHAARAHGLEIMLGCFCETSVSITSLAHISPLVDYADLDGALLLANDPFVGVTFHGSQMVLPEWPGLGIVPR
jgi:L-alanine-DL-glutamate epimerase-like enolase superfamily enzyme